MLGPSSMKMQDVTNSLLVDTGSSWLASFDLIPDSLEVSIRGYQGKHDYFEVGCAQGTFGWRQHFSSCSEHLLQTQNLSSGFALFAVPWKTLPVSILPLLWMATFLAGNSKFMAMHRAGMYHSDSKAHWERREREEKQRRLVETRHFWIILEGDDYLKGRWEPQDLVPVDLKHWVVPHGDTTFLWASVVLPLGRKNQETDSIQISPDGLERWLSC